MPLSESFDALISVVRDALSAPLPGIEGQLLMAPHHRAHPESLSVEGRPCKQAAVLVVLTASSDIPHLLLTVRKSTLSNHAGQISLPGGRQEAGEELVDTALRETEEEVGILRQEVEILGRLSPLYIPPSGYCVYPFVGGVRDADPMPDEREVEQVLLAPTLHLLDPLRRRTGIRHINGRETNVPYFDLCGEIVWGATAMILAEFAHVLGRAADETM